MKSLAGRSASLLALTGVMSCSSPSAQPERKGGVSPATNGRNPTVQSNDAVPVGTAKKPSSCMWVTDGTPTSGYPAVVQLIRLSPTAQDPSYWVSCTATFVGPNALITAAHCLDESQMNHSAAAGGHLSIKLNGASVPVTKVHFMQWAGEGNAPAWPWQADIAVLEVAPGTTHSSLSIATTPAAIGDTLTLTGFGQTEVLAAGDAGNPKDLKYVGTNRVQALQDNHLLYVGSEGAAPSGQATDVVSGAGDSGGPVLINGSVAAVVSGGEQLVAAANVALAFPGIASSFTSQVLARVAKGEHLASEVDQDLTAAPNAAFLHGLTQQGLVLQFGASPAATPVATIAPAPSPALSCPVAAAK